ncbi:MAG: hypothetical protein IJ992_04680 [Lentisphaeria bacterium]|nr:hypothetical protein [Lentisphaeria bacterium]
MVSSVVFLDYSRTKHFTNGIMCFIFLPVVKSLLVFVILVEKFIIFSIKSGRIAFACLLFTSDIFFCLHQFFFKDRLLIGGKAGLEEKRKEGQKLYTWDNQAYHKQDDADFYMALDDVTCATVKPFCFNRDTKEHQCSKQNT